jgi:hypothetical protein
MKKLTNTFAAFAVTSMLAGGSAIAMQDPMPQPQPVPQPEQQRPMDQPRTADEPRAIEMHTNTATGELQSVDTEERKLKVKSAAGEEWTFTYTDSTEITGAQDGISGLATKDGAKVKVTFTGDDDYRVATKVELIEERK